MSLNESSGLKDTRDALESFLRLSGCLAAVGETGRSEACPEAGDLAAVGDREPDMEAEA